MAFFILLLISYSGLTGQSSDIQVHDPVMIRQGDTYYLYCTGFGISAFSSTDMKNWKRLPRIFESPPIWALKVVPGFRGHIWAPDISFLDGKYYLYYSVSTFASNRSCIGLAVNTTLDPDDPAYEWKDMGMVVRSVPGRDLWNAIDPSLIIDEEGVPWLVFGSFWKGMKLFRLNDSLSAPVEPEEWHTVAARPRDYYTEEEKPGEGAIEAPFLFRKNGYYYLFVSFDFCCRGIESNYKIMVGRSEKITGPYLDRHERDMVFGGGTLVLEGNERWPGVGHNAIYTFDGTDYLVYHAYDAKDHGRSKLRIDLVEWDEDGWPVIQINE
ncbi:MAG: arabinan endo-1,5-alpha-L-arabinosidase [Bacteroidales bacterium]|nr:arabinan endo-1,5-alpha-L-arabinosidase [Bacteroidales bacterium]